MVTRTAAQWCRIVLGGLMLGTAGAACASDHGFYMNVDAGIGSYSNDVRVRLNNTRYERESARGEDFAWSFAAGYRINRYVAAELGFFDLGQAQTKLVTPEDPDTRRGKVDTAARGKSLSLLAHLPIGNWDSYLKVGAIASTYDLRVIARVSDTEFQHSAQYEEVHPVIGIGTRYAFSEQWALSFALDGYLNVGPSEGRATLISPRIGFAYRF